MKGLYILFLAITVTTAYVVCPARDIKDCPIHPGCPAKDSKDFTVHLPYEADCTKFYKCFIGRGCLMDCPKSNDGQVQLVFNPLVEVCDWPMNVPDEVCQKSGSSSSSTESTSSSTESTPSSTESTPSSTESTPSSTESTPSSTESTPSSTESTPSSTESTPSSTESTPSSTESTPSSTESTPSSTESTPSSTESTPSSTESTPSSTDSTSSTSGVPTPIIPGKCPDKGKVKVPHESDCNAYYECSNGNRYPAKCLQGHVFNPCIQSCDVDGTVDCAAIINGSAKCYF